MVIYLWAVKKKKKLRVACRFSLSIMLRSFSLRNVKRTACLLTPSRSHSSVMMHDTVSNTGNRLRLGEEKYTECMSTPFPKHIDSALKALAKETRTTFSNAHMMVSQAQAQMLHQWIRMLGPKHVLEIGTFTGYSTLAIASAMQSPMQSLISLEVDPKPLEIAKKYMASTPLQASVDLRLGPAKDGY